VRCWGANGGGQAGLGPATQPKPVEVSTEIGALLNVEAIAASSSSTCAALTDKTVVCWGANNNGELGLGGATDANAHPDPQPVVGVTGATALWGASGNHFCAIVANGEVRCWGANFDGQIGDGSSGAAKTTAVAVCTAGATAVPCTAMTGVKAGASGDNFTCAIQADGQVACWGKNSAKQIGIDTAGADVLLPRLVGSLTGATALAGGNAIMCAATNTSAKCWGGGLNGMLGNATQAIQTIPPVSVCTKQDCSTLLTNVTSISTADESVCTVSAGAVKCWGSNTGAQLGDGTTTGGQNFAATSVIATGGLQVASGGPTNFALVVDGPTQNVKCWGDNGSSHCGSTTFTEQTAKSPISPTW